MEAAQKQHAPQLMLRLAVEGGGCSGFQYVYEFEKDAANEEEDVYVLRTVQDCVGSMWVMS